MAALSAVTRLVHTGQEIILNNDSYGGTYRLLSKVGQQPALAMAACLTAVTPPSLIRSTTCKLKLSWA